MKKFNKKPFKKTYQPFEFKQKIYSEQFNGADVTISYAIDHEKGLSGYALSIGRDLVKFSLDIEKIFDECTPASRGEKLAIDLVDSAKARFAYTVFKEKMLPRSTYLSNQHWFGKNPTKQVWETVQHKVHK